MRRFLNSKLGAVVFVIGFVLLAGHTRYPINAIAMLICFLLIILGVIAAVRDFARETSQRFWDALERPHSPSNRTAEDDDPDYIPYAVTRYRRR
jgi:hypothetical protein